MNVIGNQIVIVVMASVLLGAVTLIPLFTEAKSETWERTFDSARQNKDTSPKGIYFFKDYNKIDNTCKNGYHTDKKTGEKKPCGFSKMVLTSTSVTYRVKILNAATDAVIPDGGTVPVGTRIVLQFQPYEDVDTNWFGGVMTWGGYTDSPHGKWVSSTPTSDHPGAECNRDDYLDRLHGEDSEVLYYGDYHVATPSRSITGTGGLTCGALSGREMNCTVSSSGTFTPVFNFSATESRFWAMEKDMRDNYGDGACRVTSDGINVSAVRIPYTIIGSQPNRPPTKPVIDGPTTGKPDISYTFGARSTDPDSDNIRYGVDINGDNSGVDMWVPSTTFVSSGTRVTYSNPASLWSATGAKSFSVLAEDENGARSGWAKHTIMLSVDGTEEPPEDPEEPGDPSDPDEPGGPGDVTSCPAGYLWDPVTSACKSQACFDSFFCQGTNLYRGSAATCSATLVQACAPGTCSAGACFAPPGPQIVTWEVKPTLGIKGYKTTIRWNAVDVESCVVTGTNGYEAPGNNETVNAIGEEEDTVNFETTYTLTCEGLDGTTVQRQTTVRLAPIQNED